MRFRLTCIAFSAATVLTFSAGPADGQTTPAEEIDARTQTASWPSARVSEGGVRIRSFRGHTRILRSPAATAPSAISRLDLELLEQRILSALERRFNQLFDELVLAQDLLPGAGPGSYVVLFPADGDAPPDTVELPVRDPDDPFSPRTFPAPRIEARRTEEVRRAVLSPLLERIETEIFDTGLFNAVSVNFEFGGANILPGSEPALDAIGEILTRHPELYLRVGGHTDNIGSRAVNQRLSEERARAAAEYILELYPSIERERLEPVGMGMEDPIASNATETGRAMNRRVVFRITEPPVREPQIPDVPLVQRMEYRPPEIINVQYAFDW